MSSGANFLDVFDDDEEPDLSESLAPALPARQEVVSPRVDSSQLLRVVGPNPKSKRIKSGRQITGVNSRGTELERKNWNLRMQVLRARAKHIRTESSLLALLSGLKKRSHSDSAIRLHKRRSGDILSKQGLVKMSFLKAQGRGNRYCMKYSMSDFLLASFGNDYKAGRRIVSRNCQALAMQAPPSIVAAMRAVSAGAVFSKQASCLAKLYLLCKRYPPLACGLREAFDETSQLITVSGEKGAWQLIVLKHALTIVWPGSDGGPPQIMNLPIVCPPLLVLSPSADRLWLGCLASCLLRNGNCIK